LTEEERQSATVEDEANRAKANPGDDGEGRNERSQSAEAGGADEITRAQAEINQWKDMYIRSRAEYENLRKRSARDQQDAVNRAESRVVEKFAAVIDNFERALEQMPADENDGHRQGVEMIYRQFMGILTDLGVEAVEAAGQPFDPDFHQAVATEVNDGVPEGTVTKQYQRGYRYAGRLIRPAMVVVSVKGGKEQ
jgi:molecular chaperone GrpE